MLFMQCAYVQLVRFSLDDKNARSERWALRVALAMLTWYETTNHLSMPTIEELLIDQHFVETCCDEILAARAKSKVKVVADDSERLEEGLRPNCIMRHLEG